MTTAKKDAKSTEEVLDDLVKKAERLLQAQDGYNRADEYNRGVEAVIDLLKRHN